MTEIAFSNHFWGLKDDGFYVLTAKMNSTKKTFDEIKSFYSVRASLHEEFGKKLMKHAKAGMGREETGTLHALLSSAHKEMEWTAQAHLNLAQKLKTRLEIDLDNFILEQKDKRKLTHTNVEKAHRYKQSSETYLAKVKEKYEVDCAKLRTLESQLENATSTRDAEKIRQRMERTEHEIEIQEQEYKNACVKVAEATDNWNKAWKLSCDTYQGMEKKRLEFLHHSFSMYINVLSTATSQDQESYERFWKTLDQYDPVKDIQTFISEKGTGPLIPEPEIFVPYSDDPQKTFQKHKVANFSAPLELATVSDSLVDQVKPELTVRNPTELQSTKDNIVSNFLNRGKSIVTPKELPAEAPEPSRSQKERRKSIIRNVIKPLPSISTSASKSKRNSIKNQETHSIPVAPPVIVVPDMSSASDTSDSDENEIKKAEEEENVTIDPRAKVVFAIGNNMFDLGHLNLEDDQTNTDTSTHTRHFKSRSGISGSHFTSRRRQRSADLEAVSNISYQSLLEELGLFGEQNKSNNEPKNKENSSRESMSDDKNNLTSSRTSHRRSSITAPSSQKHSYKPIMLTDTGDNYHSHEDSAHLQDMYIMTGHEAYTLSQQPHYSSYSQQQHYANIPSAAHPANYTYQVVENNMYQPPADIPQGTQPTLFWAMALGDWYSGKPEELQYSRGTWLAVTEVRNDGWYYAIKFDSRMNCLTNEKGYVAQNYVQVYT